MQRDVGVSMSKKYTTYNREESNTEKHICIKNVKNLHKELSYTIKVNTKATGANMGIKVVG